LIYFLEGNLPWKRDLPVLGGDVLSNLAISDAIKERDPCLLCLNLDNEFGVILKYLQDLSSNTRPNYKFIKKQFLLMMRKY
jgi:hypothetical protein